MRIISGLARGRKLAPPPAQEKSIRPTSDRAREALFNILGKHVTDANVLDLFAGTGALGLESFSRNANCVVFVDNNRLAIKLIQKNIAICLKGLSGKNDFRIIKQDLIKGAPLKRLCKEYPHGFDLIFIDPPYSKNISSATLKALNKSSLLTHNGLLIVEERYNVDLPSDFSHLILTDKRLYGETAFWIYQKRPGNMTDTTL